GAPLQAPVDRDRTTLLEVLTAALGLPPEDGDAEEVGLLFPLTFAVLPAGVDGDSELADRQAARGGAHLRIASEVAGQDDAVDVHAVAPFQTHRSCSASLGLRQAAIAPLCGKWSEPLRGEANA